ACIRSLGECPCPRCMVKKKNIPLFGLVRDMENRPKLPRTDSQARRDLVEKARKYIFDKGKSVKSSVI
ncbi:hypothetical protein BDZ89DRAFT_900965, partial [Hymenopellis radicata]